MSLTDLHFDPFRDPTLFPALARSAPEEWSGIFERSRDTGFGPYGRDTSYALLVSALEQAGRAVPRLDFVVMAGDWLAHDFNETYDRLAGDRDPRGRREFIDKTMTFLARRVREQFPRAPIYAALGNEDSDCGDYQLEPRGPFLRQTARTWRGFLRHPGNERSFSETFPIGGYYAAALPGAPAHGLLVLNTVFFSAEYANRCGHPADDPGGDQLRWLGARLEEAAARRQKLWLIYHVPPGIDAFSTARAEAGPLSKSTVSFWRPEHMQAFLGLLDRHGDTVVLMLAGHTHMDDFRLAPAAGPGQGPAPMLITPAISPIFGNNPGFHVLSYDPGSLALLDYATQRLDLAAGPGAAWSEEYRFSRAYGLSPVDGVTLATLFRQLRAPGPARAAYIRYYNVSHTADPPISERTWPVFWCAIGHLTAAAFQACAGSASGP